MQRSEYSSLLKTSAMQGVSSRNFLKLENRERERERERERDDVILLVEFLLLVKVLLELLSGCGQEPIIDG